MIDKIWKTNNFVSSALLPLSFLYFLIIQIYKIIKYEKKCDVPVICVGNLTGFSKEVLNKLPMEFAVEAQKLLEISLEGSVG